MDHGGESWENEHGETVPLRMVRDAVPTARHSEMLFRMVVDLLGADAYVESANGGKQRVLFRRGRVGGTTYVPWPLLSLRSGGRLSHIVMFSEPDGPPVKPTGEVVVHDGPESVTVTYGEGGRWCETARSHDVQALAGVVPALEQRSAMPAELLAQFIADVDVERHGPGTLHMPVPLPGAMGGVWQKGLRGIRHGLFHERIPADAQWAVADGYDGIALAWGDTREEALTRWRAEVERLQPRPPAPEPMPPTPPGFVTLRAPPADGAWPAAAPDNTPAAIVRLAPPPRAAAPFGAWTRLLGMYGTTVPAALRRDPAGFTLVGDELAAELGAAGLASLDEELDAVALPPLGPAPEGWERPPYNSRVTHYRMDPPAVDGTWHSESFDPGGLDGDRICRLVVRQRWLDLES